MIIGQSVLVANAMWLTRLGLFFTQVAAAGDVLVAICETEGGKPNIEKTLTRVTVPVADLKKYPVGGVTVAGVRTGMQALLDGKSRFNAQPRLIVAPGHSRTQAVATAMDGIATKLKAIAIVDGPNGDDDDAIAFAQNFGSKRVYMVDSGLKVWDTTLNAETIVPASPYVAGLFCRTDKEYGFWGSPSNKEFLGVIGTARPVEFLDGDDTCRANLLNAANITTIIRDGGYRLWGNRTLSADPKWAFVTRVRTLDIVMDAILYGHKWAVDRSITKTYVKDVTEGLQNFMRDLKALGAIINFEVYPDPELNTASQLEQGRVYWNIRFTDVPPAENPQFRVEVDHLYRWMYTVAGGAAVIFGTLGYVGDAVKTFAKETVVAHDTLQNVNNEVDKLHAFFVGLDRRLNKVEDAVYPNRKDAAP